MAQKHYLLAHDLGTTGNKATLFHLDGSIAASTLATYPTNYPHPNWAEQDPADWQTAIFSATRQLLAESGAAPADIAAVSFSGHMQGALVVDEKGLPLRPAIIWADQRAQAQADFIAAVFGATEIYQLTGNRVSPAYTAAKLLWIKDNQPDIFHRIHKVLQAKDYAAFLLTGVFATDYSDASLTQLLDLQQRCWSTALLDKTNLPLEILPDLHPSAAVIGTVTAQAAAASGLQAGTPVVIGGGDGACATVGSGAIKPGDAYTYIGSSSWIALSAPLPVLDPQQRTFNFIHLDPTLVCPIGTMQSAGGAFDWLERLFRADGESEPQYDRLNQAISQVPPGATGLLFLPYLLGERSPHWSPLARAAFVGLSMPNGQAEMARAVMEGVAFNLRAILDSLQGQGLRLQAMRLIGGGGHSAVWRQILADVYNLPLWRVELPAAATALGAAIAGGVGVGLYPDYNIVHQLTAATAAEQPNPKTHARYEALYRLFNESYAALAPIYQKLASLPEEHHDGL
jgi:xylulokinase